MPTFRITSPEGHEYEVNAPEGATEQDAISYVQQNHASLSPVSTPATQPAAQPQPEKTWGEAIMGDEQNRGIARTGFDQGMQGMTFGFADEVQDRIGALIASTYTGEKYDDMLKMAREASKQRLAEQFQQRPGLSIAANVAGGLLTGGAGAETAVGKTVAGSLRNGVVLGKDLGTAGRVAKGVIAGAAQGAAYGAGSANDGARGEGAVKGAVLGGGVGLAAPVVGNTLAKVGNYAGSVVKGFGAKAAEEVPEVTAALKKIAAGNYDKMRQAGAVFNDNAANDLVTKIRAGIDGNEFIPELNPKTLAIINKIEDRATDPKAGGLSLSELDQYRRLLGRVGATEDGVSAGAARKAIDDFVNGTTGGHLVSGDPAAVQMLNQGRKQYAQASKFEEVADIISKAEGDPNKIKRGLSKYLKDNDHKPPGWSRAEVKALRQAASAGGGERLMRFIGKTGFDWGTNSAQGTLFNGMLSGGLGYSFLNPAAGLAIPAVGTVAKQTYKMGTRGQAQALLDLLEKGPQVNNGMLPALYGAAQPYAGVAQRQLTNSMVNQMMPSITTQPDYGQLVKRFY